MMDEAFFYYSKFDPHDTITLIYDLESNCFMDDRGNIIYDIYKLISPNQLLLFREELPYVFNEFIFTVPDVTNSFLIDIYYAEVY